MIQQHVPLQQFKTNRPIFAITAAGGLSSRGFEVAVHLFILITIFRGSICFANKNWTAFDGPDREERD